MNNTIDATRPSLMLHVSCNPRVAHGQAPKSLTDRGKHGLDARKHDICI